MGVVPMGNQHVSYVEPVALDHVEQSFVEDARIDHHGVAPTVGSDYVGVGKAGKPKMAEELHEYLASSM
jgi:hypothetical protein